MDARRAEEESVSTFALSQQCWFRLSLAVGQKPTTTLSSALGQPTGEDASLRAMGGTPTESI